MNLFNKIAISKPKKNAFDLSHENKLSMNMNDLVPFYLEEIVPGDSFKVNAEVLMRLAPMVAPVMHRVNVFTHFFFVPNRLVWDEWEDFITGGSDGTETPTFPKVTCGNSVKTQFVKGSLADYLGVPVPETGTITDSLAVSALPFRAYQLIYNEYYRDQNLTDPIDFSITGTVTDQTYLTTMRKRAWEKDYFTSALPWAQRGNPVNLPIDAEFSPQYADPATISTLTGSGGNEVLERDSSDQLQSAANRTEKATLENLVDPQVVDTTSVTINDLRVALKLQMWLEKNARGGARYVEQILSHFGVILPDLRANRPLYLGGGKQSVVISEVLASTVATDQELGTMGGHGISVGTQNKFKKTFVEHGYVIGIISVLPRTAYQQGVDKSLFKFDKFDYFFPEFANLGEQEIINSELYHDYLGSPTNNDAVFGYTPRYAEYKFRQTKVHGDFLDSLYFWHLGRIFTTKPSLNTAFVEANADDRIFAVDDDWATNKLYVQIFLKVRAIRPMPKFGTPTI